MYDTATNADLIALVASEADKPQSKLRVLAQCMLDWAVHDPEEGAFASLDLFLRFRESDLFEESFTPRAKDRATLLDGFGRTFYLQ